MKSYLSFAWKELKAQKVMAVLILIAMLLSTVMTTVVSRSVGILQAMRIEQASGLNGNRYATFHQLTKEQSEILHADSRLMDVTDLINIGNMQLADSSLTLFLREYLEHALDTYSAVGKIKEGNLPQKANEIALPEEVLPLLGQNASVGDNITLDLSIGVMDGSIPRYEYRASFKLTGILENNYLGYASGTVDAVVGKGTAEALLPEDYLFYTTDFKTYSKKEFQNIVTELAGRLSLEERYVQYNWVLLDALGISYDEAGSSNTDKGFSFMAFACVLVGALVLFAAGLVIYNIMKISVTKRIVEYGILRAIGGEKGQIYRLVSLQLLILGGIGIPIGLGLGSLSAKAVLAAAVGVLNPKLFMAGSTQELKTAIDAAGTGNLLLMPASALITAFFALLAAFPAAHYAAGVSPTVAMSGTSVKVRRHVKKNKKIRNFEAYYARLNLKRGRGRTVITILSLVMSITIFITLKQFTVLLDTSSDVKKMHPGDYAVTNETVGISKEAVRDLQSQEAVESLSTVKLSVFAPEDTEELPFETNVSVKSHETLQLAGIDEEQLLNYLPGLTKEEKQALADGTACLIKNPIPFSYDGEQIPRTELHVGDTVTINDKKLTVIGLVDNGVTINNDGYLNGVQIIVKNEIYDSATGNDRYSEIYPVLKENTDEQEFERWLNGWCEGQSGTHWLSYKKADAQMEESFAQTKMLCVILIVFIAVIGILNIINTVYSNIHTRIAEIGIQRAIGMSAGSLYRTFLWEGAYYGIYASLIGTVTGYLCSVVVGAARTDMLTLVAFPARAVLEAALMAVAACLLATAVPLRAIARMDIVASIENVE